MLPIEFVRWDLVTGENERLPENSGTELTAVAYSPDGKSFVTADRNGGLIWWDNGRLAPLRQTKLPGFLVSIAFRPDGKGLLVSDFHAVLQFDENLDAPVRTFALNGLCMSVSWLADGRYALAASGQNVVIWDTQTGDKLRELAGHTSRVEAVSISADGRTLFTASADGTVRLWDVATGLELAALVSLSNGSDWVIVSPDGLFDGSPGGREKVAFRVGNGLNVVPVDRFFQDFYRPGLLAGLWAGLRPTPDVKLGAQNPPSIKLVSPQVDGRTDAAEVTVVAEVTDAGGGIEGPWLVHNGAHSPAGQNGKAGRDPRRSFTVTLLPGENQFEVWAACADGSWKSDPAKVRLISAKAPERVRMHILAVGISQYADNSLNLKYAAADAQDMAALFAKRGPALFASATPRVLVDAAATRDGIRQALKDIAAAARPENVLVLFLAGHGTTIGQRISTFPTISNARMRPRSKTTSKNKAWLATCCIPGSTMCRRRSAWLSSTRVMRGQPSA